jgi:aminopeptidase N
MLEHVCFKGALNFETKSLQGTAFLDIHVNSNASRQVVLDAVDFIIQGVYVNDSAADYTYDGVKLTIKLPFPAKRIRVSVDYSVKDPKAGIHFVAPFQTVDGSHQAWTQGECRGTRYWLPVIDAPSVKCTSELVLSVPLLYTVVSNGSLISCKTLGDRKTYHWFLNKPHSPYLVCFAVAVFEKKQSECEGVKLGFYVPKGRKADIDRSFGKTCDMMNFFAEWTNVGYPYSSYSQCCVSQFSYAGMENTTCSILSEHTLHDETAHKDFSSEDPDFYSDDVVSHELAHQWFGDLVSCRDWGEVWLNESFATLLQALYFRRDKGDDEFAYNLILKLGRYLEEASTRHIRSLAVNSFAAPEELLDRHANEKGALVLHTLMNLIGETAFRKSVELYLKRFGYGSATTRDLEKCFEETTGLNIKWFFEQWIRWPGHPVVDVYWNYSSNGQTKIRFVQSSTGVGPYTVPVEVRIRLKDRDVVRRVLLSKRVESFYFETGSRPLYVCVDPEMSIVGLLRTHEAEPSVLAKATSDSHLYCRILAIRQLSHLRKERTVVALSSLLFGKVFWGISSEAATSLGHTGLPSARSCLLRATIHPDPRVRRSVALALSGFKGKSVLNALTRIMVDDPSYYVKASAAASLGKVGRGLAFSQLLRALSIESQNDVVARSAISALADTGKKEALGVLLRYTRAGAHDLMRRAATLALASYAAWPVARRRLRELMKDPDFAVRISAVEAAKRSGRSGFIRSLREVAKSDVEGSVVGAALDALEFITVRRVRVVT